MCQSRPARARRGTFVSADPFAARAAFCRRSQSCPSPFPRFFNDSLPSCARKADLGGLFLAAANFLRRCFQAIRRTD